MTQATFTYTTPVKYIGSFVADAFISETYLYENQMSEIPIESGVNITDTVVEQPDEITIELVKASYTQIPVYDYVNDYLVKSNLQRRKIGEYQMGQPFRDLLQLKRDRQPISVSTGVTVYNNMIITSLQIPRDVTTGADLRATVVLRKLPIITSSASGALPNQKQNISASNQVGGVSDVGKGTKQEKGYDVDNVTGRLLAGE